MSEAVGIFEREREEEKRVLGLLYGKSCLYENSRSYTFMYLLQNRYTVE